MILLQIHRFWVSVCALFGVAFLMCICLPYPIEAGSIEDRDGKTIIHVTVAKLPNPADTGTFNQAELAGVRAFRKRFPAIFAEKYAEKYKANPRKYGHHNWDNVEVDLREFSGIEVPGIETDLLAIAGGMPPDVLYVNFRKSDNYIRNNFLYPLDKPEDGYVTGMTKEELDFRINKKLWPVIKRKGLNSENHVWAIPYGGALGKVLMFRKDLFDENGISYPTTKWTWADMFAAAKKITNPMRGIYGFYSVQGKYESWYWITFLWSAGGEVMTYNEGADEWRCVFDSHEAAVSLEFYTRLNTEKWIDKHGKVRRGYSTKEAGNARAKWSRGEVGMMMEYIDERIFATINPELTGMVPVPLGPTGKRGGELNSRMMGLFSKIKDTAVRDAGWEYIRFYDSEEASEIKTRIMVEGGLGRFVNPKLLRRSGYHELERLSPKGWSETFRIAIETGKPEPYGKNSNFAYSLMTYPIQEAEQLALADKLPENKKERTKVMHGLLKDACARANEMMIGVVTPRERLKRRIAAVATLLAICITFGLVFRRIIHSFMPTDEAIRRKGSWQFKRYLWAYLLLVPAIASILVWRYVPLLRGSVMAFFDYRLLAKSTWVGVDNFGDLLYDGFWWASVWNALRYSFLVIFMTFVPPIILAILLQEVPRGRLLLRTIFYLPAVITGLVTVVLWKQFYEPSEKGALNALITRVPAIGFITVGLLLLVICLLFTRRLWAHEMYLPAWCFVIVGLGLFSVCASMANPILFQAGESIMDSLAHFPVRLFNKVPEPYRWLGNPETAMLACVLPMVWAGMGPGCLIYLAALKGIANDYYEAADIDGATFIDKILFVVFPHMKMLIIINFVGVFIRSWYQATGNILVMTGGGAKTEVAGLHIWYKAFTYLDFGPATAMAWMLGFMLIGFTVYQLQILSKVEFKAAGAKE